MRRAIVAAGLLAAMGGTALPALAGDPILGTWRTTPGTEGGHLLVRIEACGAAFCGTIVEAVDARGVIGTDYEHLGKRMIRDMSANGDGSFAGGQIWAPEEDRTYRLHLTLTDAGLAVRGCVLAFCRDAGVWTRVD